MIRFRTDTAADMGDIFSLLIAREKKAMRALGISLCVAFTVWMAGAGALAFYSREIAVFMVSRGWL